MTSQQKIFDLSICVCIGWWAAPKAWKANTAVAAAAVSMSSAMVFSVSASKERRPIPPYKHIPSQRWCKHAYEDDPSLT